MMSEPRSAIAPTPKDVLLRDGTASLYRFRPTGPSAAPGGGAAVLLVPSMINRWYVLDLRAKASLAASLVKAGLDVYCLDWGAAEDEDRYLAWDDVIAKLHRTMRRVRRITGASKLGVLGYCMGGTLAGIATALEPEHVGAFVNLAAPFDFSRAGLLGTMVDPRWFDAAALTEPGNIAPPQMQSGFVMLRPTAQIGKWLMLADKAGDKDAKEAFEVLETWANDNIPFPGAAYRTYIQELYQQNLLYKGEHHVRGRRVDLGAVRCPVLTITAERDTICPPGAARGLHDKCGSLDKEIVVVPGGHVGAVVGSRAPRELYPRIARFFSEKLGAAARQEEDASCN